MFLIHLLFFAYVLSLLEKPKTLKADKLLKRGLPASKPEGPETNNISLVILFNYSYTHPGGWFTYVLYRRSVSDILIGSSKFDTSSNHIHEIWDVNSLGSS